MEEGRTKLVSEQDEGTLAMAYTMTLAAEFNELKEEQLHLLHLLTYLNARFNSSLQSKEACPIKNQQFCHLRWGFKELGFIQNEVR